VFEEVPVAKQIFLSAMDSDYQMYCALYDTLMEHYTSEGVEEQWADKKASEDARYLLPNAALTNIVMSVNLRELIHICNERLCQRAQWEIRDLFELIKDAVVVNYPWLRTYLVPKCAICKETDMCPQAIRRNVS
jgi:thymidylate synthase (FAD)